MGRLAAVARQTAKPDPKRERPQGTKTWATEYEFQGACTKYTIGGYSCVGTPGDSIADWLRHGQQFLRVPPGQRGLNPVTGNSLLLLLSACATR